VQAPFTGEDLNQKFRIVEQAEVYCCPPPQWWEARKTTLQALTESKMPQQVVYIEFAPEDAGARQQRPGKRHQVVFVAACAVEEQQHGAAGISRRLVDMDEIHYSLTAGACIFSAGSTSSMRGRAGSSHGGSTSASPRCAASSSTANPGPSVASSKSTPPGSLK